jgi:CheY-like chemotaxis protein
MPSVPRIVVVDPAYDVARIVRGALTLLNRQHILIEVPTSEDTLEEVRHSEIDLVVTAYQLPGRMHGVDLAQQISHESLGTPVIVLADEGDPQIEAEALAEAPFQYFVRPVAEPFLRGLRIALDGEVAVEAEEVQATPASSDLGPVPNINIEELRGIIGSLVRDVGAMGAVLADRTGRVLIETGAIGYIDRETLAAILGPSFAHAAQISPLVGGDAWAMQYYDGERLDVFGLALGIHYFMCLIFEGSNRGAFGAVTMFGRRAADQMIDMLGEAAYAAKKPEPLPPPKEKEPVPAPAPAPAAPAARPQEEVAEELAAFEALFDEHPNEPMLEPVADFDPDALFGQAIDAGLADSLFDENTLSDLAASIAASEGERVGYDEAIDMGILDE